jgi:hypothetical protein
LTTAAAVLVALVSGGCDATFDGVASRAPRDPSSTHWGFALSGHVHLPRTYSSFGGAEIAHLVQRDPKSSADQTRINAIFGFSEIARAEGSRLSPELTFRAGLFRGSNGPLVSAGFLAGANLALGIRHMRNEDPWERDGLLSGTLSLVPAIGANALVPEFRFADTAPEVWGGIGLRFTLSSTLVP